VFRIPIGSVEGAGMDHLESAAEELMLAADENLATLGFRS
jgi:hypothetical protein